MKKTVLILVLTLICILALALCTSAAESARVDSEETPDIILGDVDGDGSVTNADVLMIYKYIYSSELYPLPVSCGHSYSNWTVVTPTTCDSDGIMVRVCSKCLATEESTVEGGHVYDSEMTCKRCGYNEAYEAVVSEGLNFKSNGNGTCYVSGIGTCTDTDIVIPATSPDGDKVTAIGKNAFEGRTSLTSVTLPSGVVTVNSYAFKGCISLKNIIWSSSLSEIGSYAFEGCTSITRIELPSSVKKIGDRAFNGCTSVDTVVLNEGLVSLGENVLASTAITELVIPDSVTTISYSNSYNYSIVEDCQKLRRVVVGEGITTLPAYMFQGLTALEEVVIGSNVKTVATHAFEGCTALTDIVIPNNVTTLNSYAFKGCINLQNITWSGSLSEIGSYAFEGCTSITRIELPLSVKKIGDRAFNGCTSVDTVVLNEGLVSLGENVLANTAITELVIPDSVTTISYSNSYNYSIVEDCQKLRRVVVGEGITTLPAYMFEGLTALEEVVIGPNVKTVATYAFEGCTSLVSIVIPNNVTTINSYVFSGCINLSNITWSNSLSEIGAYAFNGCTSLKSVRLPSSVKKLGDCAFIGCTALDTVILNEGLTSLGENALSNTAITELVIPDSVTTIYYNGSYNHSVIENCQKLKRVVIGDGVTLISAYMFEGLTALEEVVIGPNVKTIAAYAFEGCTALTDIVIPNNVTTINSYVFSGCINLSNITWSNSLSEIGAYAFNGCTSLKSVRLPSSVKKLGDCAFIGCTALDTVILNEGLTSLGENALSNTAITELVIPDSVTTIYYNGSYNHSVIENCQKLKRVVVGEGITTLPAFMFQGLTALEEVVIGSNVTAVGAYAFSGCVSLTSITLPESVVTINNYAFSESGLDNITIPKNVSTVGDYAFASCKNLEYLLIEGTALKKIGKNVTNACPSARRIYYKGTVTDWNAITINATNAAPFNKIPYIYSENSPAEEGNYWHYANNGEPIVWEITVSEYKVYAMSNAYSGTMGSSLLSCSTSYVKEMESDSDFMAQKILYDAATLVSDLGEALENQMNKEQLYMIVLLDVLGYSNANGTEVPELANSIMKYGTFAALYVEKAGEVIDKEAFKELYPSLGDIGTAWDVFIDLAETANDRDIAMQNLMGFAMQCQSSVDILTKISNDTNNDRDLRNAAMKVIDIIESAFDGTLTDLINTNANVQVVSTLTTTAISTIWDIGCEAYLPAKIAKWVATGIKVSLDLFCDTGVSVDAYYKLKVTSVIENALRSQINSLSGDYLRRENLNASSSLYAVINLYSTAISKGYEYTLEYLNTMGKDSDYILSSYVHNTDAFKQYELEVESEYYSLYAI